MRLRFRTLAAFLVALALGLPVAAAPALAADDNEAIAINTEDGSSLFRFAFDIHRTVNDVIDETNIAISYASCESCQTVSVAIQIVLVASEANAITPQNIAISLNEECTLCETMTEAQQYVVGIGGPLKIDSQGRRTIAQVRRAFLELGRRIEAGELTAAEIEQEVLPLIAQIRDVVANHVVSADTPDIESRDDGGATPAPSQSASPEPTASASASPSDEPEESPSPSPSASAEASPSPTASAST
ncbi:MAG TPA: hypothetical protein VHJ78_02150 [Actinomycetota bacterium]|nr:hypothetical protein [Actinomycetota bacterium]